MHQVGQPGQGVRIGLREDAVAEVEDVAFGCPAADEHLAGACLNDTEALVLRLADTMARDRSLPDEDYDVAVELLGRAKLAEVTWLVGYYAALALALAVFRPAG